MVQDQQSFGVGQLLSGSVNAVANVFLAKEARKEATATALNARIASDARRGQQFQQLVTLGGVAVVALIVAKAIK